MLAVCVLGLVPVGLAVAGQSRNFSVHLSGDLELPIRDTDAQGQAVFHLSKDGTTVSYKLITANIRNVTMAHIHIGPATCNCPVGVWLYPDGPPAQLVPGRSDGVLAAGTFTAADFVGPLAGRSMADLIALMESGGAYVNVHTSQFPPGEIRGNL